MSAFPAAQGAPTRGAGPADGTDASWADLDGDGRLDALSITAEGRLRLLANRPEGFEDVSERAGLGGIDAVALALWHDYDGDGRADLFVGRARGASLLLCNQSGSFVDMAAGAGLVIDEPVRAAHWLDEDGDGRLDLHVVTSTANRIWRGLEGGFFAPVELPLEPSREAGRALAGAPVLEHADGPALDGPELGGPRSGTATERPTPIPGRDGVRSRASAARPASGSSTGSAGASSILPFPSGCAQSIRDEGSPGTCLQASSVATLGMLYPLSSDLFVDEATGNVGIGTTTPAYALEVEGQLVSGVSNSASGSGAAVGGGKQNLAGGAFATIAGGQQNTADSKQSSIGGGRYNLVQEGLGTAGYSTIGGGYCNKILGVGLGTIGGGTVNLIAGFRGTICGGGGNHIEEGSDSCTIGGGQVNRADGAFSTVPGGSHNEATAQYSFAAGRRALALHDGSFVWGDSQDLDKPSSATDQFNVYAEGGLRVFANGVAEPSMVVDGAGNVGMGTAAPAYRLHVEGKLVSGTSTSATGDYAAVGGGRFNYASGWSSTVSGGSGNGGSGAGSTVGGGAVNFALGPAAAVSGGMYNLAEGASSTVSGGYSNLASGVLATVSGGKYNRARERAATVSGGYVNEALGRYSAIVGGVLNDATGLSSSVSGGKQNLAGGDYSFAAGRRAKALHAGSFVWGDSQDVDKPSSADDQFNVYAEGGLRVFSTGAVKPSLVVDKGGNVGLGTSTPAFTLEVDGTAGKPGGGSWSVSSDARLKKNVEDLEGALATLLALRGVSFEYIDPAAIGELEGRRIGFLAQEVERVLPDWVDEKADGTKVLTVRGFEALAVEALRELGQASAAKDARIAELEERGRSLERRIEDLESVRAEVEALRARLAGPGR